MKIAIFDFDGTLYKYETFTLFMKHLKERFPKKYVRFLSTILPIYVGYKSKIIPERKMKRRLMHHYLRALRTLTKDEMDQFFAEIVYKMEGDFHPEIAARIQSHQTDGYHTMIVSGAFTPLLEIVNKIYHLDTLIGTDIPHENAVLDHVHAERKTSLIQAQLEGTTINWEESYAYGDSLSDLSVLELVGHPVAVAPDQELVSIAKERKWEIIY